MRVWLGVLNAYGSVRWSIEVDIKSVIAPKFENNVILASTERLIMNTPAQDSGQRPQPERLYHRPNRPG